MPTVISHGIVGLAAGNIFPVKDLPKRFWFFTLVCPMLPDADVIGFRFGIHYGDFFGHRGFFHSLFFALLLALFVVCVFFRDKKIFSKDWFLFVLYFFLLTGTHGVLDAFTDGGLGIALLSPFDNSRIFFPWQPIEVAPIGISRFFSPWGVRVMLSEMLWVWLPSISLMIFVKLLQLISRSSEKKVNKKNKKK